MQVQIGPDGEFSKERSEYADAMLIILSVCDDNGDLRFSDDQLQSIADLPAYVTRPIIEAATELNAADTVDEAKKN